MKNGLIKSKERLAKLSGKGRHKLNEMDKKKAGRRNREQKHSERRREDDRPGGGRAIKCKTERKSGKKIK